MNVVIDGRPQILQLTARRCFGHKAGRAARAIGSGALPRRTNPRRDIGAAAFTVHIGERVGLPKFGERRDALCCFLRPRATSRESSI